MARMSGGQSDRQQRNTGRPNSGTGPDPDAPPPKKVGPGPGAGGQPNKPPPPPKAIATPKLADNSAAASDRYWSRIKEGENWANQHFAEGSMGRMTDPRAAQTNELLGLQRAAIDAPGITDPRQKEMNELLARQKAGMDGLDAKENLAMKEQGTAEINRQMAQSMEKYAGMAGAQGVRGGAAASLQGRALMEAGQQNADFQRKMILDEVAIKQQAMDRYGSTLGAQQNTELGIQQFNTNNRNQAMDRYGNTLGQQQNTELGIQQYNNGQANAELYGRTTVPFQIAAGIDATQAGLDATSLNQAQLGLGTQQVNDARTQTWRDSQTAAADKKAATKAQAEAEAAANQGGKIICTEAERQGLISSEQLATSRAFGKSHLSYSELRSYWTWATPIVRLMRVSPAVARIVASLLPALIAEEGYSIGQEGARSTLRGRITLRCFRALNRVFLNASARKVARLAHG